MAVSAGLDRYRIGAVLTALVAECAGELAAQPGVLVGELPVAVEGDGEPGAERGIGGPLAAGGAGPGGAAAARSSRIWPRKSGWVYSQDREIPAVATTDAKVTGAPARSSSRRAWMALARVSSCRRAARR